MRTLLYRVGREPIDCEAEIADFASIIGAPEIGWTTVRLLKIGIVHDVRDKDSGKPVCQVLGTTPIYGDFLVTCIDWDDDGTTEATSITDGFASMVKHMVFTKGYGKDVGESEERHGDDRRGQAVS